MNRLRMLGAVLGAAIVLGCASFQRTPVEPQAKQAVPDSRQTMPSFLRHEGYHDGAELDATRTVAPGITHRFTSHAEGPLAINTVFVDMTQPDLVLEAEKGQKSIFKRETVISMTRRLFKPARRPVAGINADFWAGNSAPINLFVDEGMIWRSPWKGERGQRRSIFAFDEQGNFAIGQPEFRAALRQKGGTESIEIGDINFPQEGAEAVAYTWPLGEKAPAPPEGGTQVVLRLARAEWVPNAPAEAVVHEVGAAGEAALAPDRVVLHLRNPAPAWLRPGAQVVLDARLDNVPGKVLGVVGGGPQLVEGGENVVMQAHTREGIALSFVTTRHPRTAVGIMPDGKTVVFVVVDGRQPSLSRGIGLEELADYMKSLGVKTAMNLDGGGSSTMVVRDEVVNFPSDAGGPRSVTNALVVSRTAPVGPLAMLEIAPRNVLIPTASRIPLRVNGYDDGYEPVPVWNDWVVEYKVIAGDAAVTGGILEVGEKMGTVTVQATARPRDFLRRLTGAGGPTATASYDIATPVGIELHPWAMLLDEGDEKTVRLTLQSGQGRPFWHDPALAQWTWPAGIVSMSDGALKAHSPGSGMLTARIGDLEARMPFAVGRFRETLAEGFEQLPAANMSEWIVAANHDPEKTAITLDTSRQREGAAAWNFRYGMVRGGTTKIELPIEATLPGEPLAVGVWVYGDGQGQWLRGELRDANGGRYYLDFTNADEGIAWKDEWRFVKASLVEPTPIATPTRPFAYPVTVRSIYIAQAQEAAKRDGQIWIDALTALDLP